MAQMLLRNSKRKLSHQSSGDEIDLEDNLKMNKQACLGDAKNKMPTPPKKRGRKKKSPTIDVQPETCAQPPTAAMSAQPFMDDTSSSGASASEPLCLGVEKQEDNFLPQHSGFDILQDREKPGCSRIDMGAVDTHAIRRRCRDQGIQVNMEVDIVKREVNSQSVQTIESGMNFSDILEPKKELNPSVKLESVDESKSEGQRKEALLKPMASCDKASNIHQMQVKKEVENGEKCIASGRMSQQMSLDSMEDSTGINEVGGHPREGVASRSSGMGDGAGTKQVVNIHPWEGVASSSSVMGDGAGTKQVVNTHTREGVASRSSVMGDGAGTSKMVDAGCAENIMSGKCNQFKYSSKDQKQEEELEQEKIKKKIEQEQGQVQEQVQEQEQEVSPYPFFNEHPYVKIELIIEFLLLCVFVWFFKYR